MMKKILFFTLTLVMALVAFGQNLTDTLQLTDSTVGTRVAEFSAARQERSVTKAEGDSA